jgi:predicted DNA binding CopG/RHH family protein
MLSTNNQQKSRVKKGALGNKNACKVHKKDAVLFVRSSDSQLKTWKKIAAQKGLNFTDWVTNKLNKNLGQQCQQKI